MAIKSRSDIATEIPVLINDNSDKEITASDVRTVLNDLNDSSVSKKGDTGLQGTVRYLNTVTIDNDYDLITKKFFDDNAPVLSDYYQEGGNNFGSAAFLGLTTNHDLSIGTGSGILTYLKLKATGETVIGGSNPIGVTPLVIDAPSGQTAHLFAIGKNGNPAFFRIDSDGRIVDIGGQTARIFSSGGMPFFPDGFISSTYASASDGDVYLDGSAGITSPFIFDARASTTNSQTTLIVYGNTATTKEGIFDARPASGASIFLIHNDGWTYWGGKDQVDSARQRYDTTLPGFRFERWDSGTSAYVALSNIT